MRVTGDKMVVVSQGSQCSIADSVLIEGVGEPKGSVALGSHVVIRDGCVLRPGGGAIVIGSHVVINHGCVFYGAGGITLGESVLLGPCVQLYTQNHGVARGSLIRLQPNVSRAIVIGGGAWLGGGVIVIGRSVGEGAVVGAGSVVTKDVPPYEIWAGNPARKIGERQ